MSQAGCALDSAVEIRKEGSSPRSNSGSLAKMLNSLTSVRGAELSSHSALDALLVFFIQILTHIY